MAAESRRTNLAYNPRGPTQRQNPKPGSKLNMENDATVPYSGLCRYRPSLTQPGIGFRHGRPAAFREQALRRNRGSED